MGEYLKVSFWINLVVFILFSFSKRPESAYILQGFLNVICFLFWYVATGDDRARAVRAQQAREKVLLDYQQVNFKFVAVGGSPLTAFESRYDAESVRSRLVDSEKFGLVNIDRYFVLVSPVLGDSDKYKIQKYYTDYVLPPHGKVTDKFTIQPESEKSKQAKHEENLKLLNGRIAQGRAARPSVRKPTGKEVCVYIMDSTGGVKVGVANDPDRRLKEVQTGSPVDVHLKFHFWFKNRADAELVEERVHETFRGSGQHARGEWFKLDAVEAYSRIREIVYSMIAAKEVDKELSDREQSEVLRQIRQKKNPYYGTYFRRGRHRYSY